MSNIIIIEDEAKAARELAGILKSIDESINVLTILDSVEQSLEWFKQNEQPDLIFSDIQLADGLCFDIYDQVHIKSPIVFCTAFDDYLMNAFETNAVSYLLKPITIEKVEKAWDKFNALRNVFDKDDSTKNLQNLLQQVRYKYKTALLVSLRDKIIPIQVKDIAFFYFENKAVTIRTNTNQKYALSSTLDDLEKVLDPVMFYRANRQFIINKGSLINAERFFARKLVAKLQVDTPETIIISKAKASEFLSWIES